MTEIAHRSTEEIAAERFPMDVEKHEMQILLNMPARHTVQLSFSDGGSFLHAFQINTGPGWLMYRGDMGCFVFERTDDMVSWFLGSSRPNPSYWSQKVSALDASSHEPGLREFSFHVLRKSLYALVVDYDLPPQGEEAFVAALEADVLDGVTDYNEAVIRLTEFSLLWTSEPDADGEIEQRNLEIDDPWEIDMRDWDYRFIWACHAIHWGLTKYRAWKPGTTSIGG